MQYVKAGLVGLLGSLIIFLIMVVGINVTGMAPFNVPPSAAFLVAMGISAKPLAIILHFAYGALWSILALAIFTQGLNIKKALILAVGVQWLLLMQLVFSPIIGWGIFGSHAGTLSADAELALNSMPKYLVMTFIVHLIYGLLNGWLIPKWVGSTTES